MQTIVKKKMKYRGKKETNKKCPSKNATFNQKKSRKIIFQEKICIFEKRKLLI
jgi:hypothetical protein